MATLSKTLPLLIIDPAGDASKKLLSQLKDSAIMVKSAVVGSLDELQRVLGQHPWQLVMLEPETEQGLISQSMKYIKQALPGVPLLLFSDNYQHKNIPPLLDQGLDGFIDLSRPRLLAHHIRQALTQARLQEAQQQLQGEYAELERRFIKLMDSSRDAIAYAHDATLILTNSSFAQRFGCKDRRDLEGTPLLDLITEQDHPNVKQILAQFSHSSPMAVTLSTQIKGPRNIPIPVEMELVPTQHNSEPSILIFIREQSSNKELENKLRVLKNQDLLTGLFNRQYFLQKLQKLLDGQRAHPAQHALLYIDMDNFKELKNRIGIAGSDQLLVEIAEQLRQLLKVTHYTARYDGNVFTALLQNTDAQQAQLTARQLARAIEGHIAEIEGRSVTTTCSIGISLISDSAPSSKELLDRAHKASIMASNAGGNQVKLYIPMDDELADHERLAQWSQRIADAIELQRLNLVYQPIVSLHGHGGEKYEALLRMQDEDAEPLSPSEFCPVAEKAGLMPQLDRWVITQALRDLLSHRSGGKDTTMFIKLSAPTIEARDFFAWFQQQLQQHTIGGEHIVFEISEEVALTHMKSIKVLGDQLQQLGCRLALDHFGHSPNSAVVQKHINAAYLKIDGAIIHGMKTDSKALEQVKTIIAIATATDSQTVAQFVEDANSLAQLWQVGVHYIQGYFVQQPDSLMRYDFSDLP